MVKQVCVWMPLVWLLVVLPIKTSAAPQSTASQSANHPAFATCPVTLPRERTRPIDAMSFFEPGTSHWKPVLILGPFGLWPEGTVVFRPGGPGEILPDGSLSMKFGWTRGEGLRGKLKINGRRLNASISTTFACTHSRRLRRYRISSHCADLPDGGMLGGYRRSQRHPCDFRNQGG
jgi:hypothetical protein